MNEKILEIKSEIKILTDRQNRLKQKGYHEIAEVLDLLINVKKKELESLEGKTSNILKFMDAIQTTSKKELGKSELSSIMEKDDKKKGYYENVFTSDSQQVYITLSNSCETSTSHSEGVSYSDSYGIRGNSCDFGTSGIVTKHLKTCMKCDRNYIQEGMYSGHYSGAEQCTECATKSIKEFYSNTESIL